MTVTERNLLQQKTITRIEIDSALQATDCLFLFTLPTLMVTTQLENTGVVRQLLGGDFKFGQSAVIIEVSSIEVLSARQMYFTSIRTEAMRGLNCRFG